MRSKTRILMFTIFTFIYAFCITNSVFAITDNHLTVEAAQKSIQINAGETCQLKVIVNADDLNGISYKWYWHRTLYDAASFICEGQTFSSISVSKSGSYSCYVYDAYGNEKSVFFDVKVENHLQVKRYTNITARSGEQVLMKVLDLEADDITGVTYQWYYDYYGGTKIPDATNDELEETLLEKVGRVCVIFDKYGNYIEAQYSLTVENNLMAVLVGYESTGYNDHLYDISEEYGKKIKFDVNVTADEMDGITYEWCRNATALGGRNENTEWIGVSSSIDVVNTEKCPYICWIRDKFGNSTSVQINLSIENHLEATPINKEVHAQKGEILEFQIEVNADNLDNISYQWKSYDLSHKYGTIWIDSYTGKLLVGESNNKIVVDNAETDTAYECLITDKYGNTKSIYFYLWIDNYIIGDADGDGVVNRADRIYLARAIAGWEGYELPSCNVADFNKDGTVNRADRIYLARAIAGWEGYALP